MTNWKKEGIQQGEMSANQEAVIEILEVKFTNVPVKIVSAVNQADDPARLKEMLREATLSASLESFEKWMNK